MRNRDYRVAASVLALANLISACDSGGGDSSSENTGGLIVTGDGNTVSVESVESFGSTEANILLDQSNDVQNDCRRSDVLRLGLQFPNADLYEFPESVILPLLASDGVRRIIEFSNGAPILLDSVVLSQTGMVNLVHVFGGPENTLMVLFDLDFDNNIRTIATSGNLDEEASRARIDFSLVPGVYCIYLSEASAEPFSDSTVLGVDYIYSQ